MTTLAATLAGGLATTGCGQRRAGTDIDAVLAERARTKAEALRLADRAAAANKKGDAAQAEELYRQALSLDRSLFQAWNDLGNLLMARHQYADAVSAFVTAADLQPADPRPLYNAGVAYQRIGWAEDALGFFEKALARDENHLDSLRGATRAAESLNRASPAILDRVHRGLLRETNDQWREYFERQRFRVEAAIQSQLRST
jgi:tetratricopeptide (TPR) repeat protein